MKKLIIALIALAIPALANQGVGGFCEQGNIAVLTSGLPSTTTVQGSFPSCTVSVFTAGTSTLITIFSDNLGTALANPFTANASGRWLFYANSNQRVDIQLSGGGLPSPWKITDVILNDPNGGIIAPSNFNSIRIVDGVKFTQNAVGINAADADLGATAGEVWIPPGIITATDAQISIRASHTLRIFGQVIIDALNRGPVLLGGTARVSCPGNFGSANLLNVSAQTNIPSMIRLSTQDGSLGGMEVDGCRIDGNGSTVTNGIIDASGAVNGPSWIKDNLITGFASAWGIFIQDIQSGALNGTNNVQMINNRITGTGTSGCIEILHSATNAVALSTFDILDTNCSPGATSTGAVLIQNPAASGPVNLTHVNLQNLLVSGMPTGQNAVTINGVRFGSFKMINCQGGAPTNCVSLSNNGPNNLGLTFDNIECNGCTNILNDVANSTTISNNFLAHYDFVSTTASYNGTYLGAINNLKSIGTSAFTGTSTFSGTTNLSGPLVSTGTDSGTQTISGSKTFSGTNSFSNTNTFTGAVNASGATSLKNQSNTRWVDGTSYACSDVGLNAAVTDVIAANAAGGTIYVGCPGTNTIAAQVNVGSASAHIQMIFLDQSLWNCTFVNAANPCWQLFPNSSMEGAAHGANQTQFTISAGASVLAILKTFSHVTPGVASHFRLRNLEFHNASSGTIANAVVDIQGAYDSSFSDLTVDRFTGRGLWIHDFTAPAGGNSLAFYNLLVDGQSTAGARPLVLEQNNGATSNGSAFHFFGGDWGHPGTGQFLVEINGHGTSAFGQISIEDIYMESNTTDTTTAIIKVADVAQVNFNDVRITRLSASSTAPGIAISETAANLTGNVGAKNISANGGTGCVNTNIITNSVAGAGTGNVGTPSCGLLDYSFLSSELGDQSQIGNQWYVSNGSSLFGNVSGARTNAVTPNFPVQIYQNVNTVTGMAFFQNGVSEWRVGMPANSNAFCFGQNDALTTCPIAWSTTGILNQQGLQVFNTTVTCTTAASVGATCTTAAITLPAAEPDTSYRAVCTGKGFAAGVPVVIGTTASSTTQFTISIAALTAVGASFTGYDCVIAHN